jgi:hypothetical protein
MISRDMKARNAPEGVVVYYYLATGADSVSVEIVEGSGVGSGGQESVRTFDGLPGDAGSHRFVWNLRYDGPARARAVPGDYLVRLNVDGTTREANVTVLKDRRLVDITVADLQLQFDFLQRAGAAMTELQTSVDHIGDVRTQVDETMERLGEARDGEPWLPGAVELADTVTSRLGRVADALVQTEGGGWDREAKLRRQLSFILNESQTQRGEYTDARPTDQWVERLGDVQAELRVLIVEMERVLEEDLAELNAYLEENGAGVGVIIT